MAPVPVTDERPKRLGICEGKQPGQRVEAAPPVHPKAQRGTPAPISKPSGLIVKPLK
jgi:hypothetical protein